MAWTAAIVSTLGLLAMALLPPSWQAAAALQRDLLPGECWRLWTAHVVHFGWPHALLDAVLLGVLLWIRPQRLTGRALALAALATAPWLSLGILWLQPGLREYRGASGLVVGLAVWVAFVAWRQRRLPRRWLALLALAAAAKLTWDALGSHGSPVLPAGVSVAWSAHLLGAVLGAVCGTATNLRTAPDPRT